MSSFKPGDQVSVTFVDGPSEEFQAVVRRVLSDEDEGLGPEIEDYVAFWMELEPNHEERIMTVTYGVDSQYSIDGRHVTIGTH